MTPDEARIILVAIAHLRDVGDRTAALLTAAIAALATGGSILDTVERLAREAASHGGRQP